MIARPGIPGWLVGVRSGRRECLKVGSVRRAGRGASRLHARYGAVQSVAEWAVPDRTDCRREVGSIVRVMDPAAGNRAVMVLIPAEVTPNAEAKSVCAEDISV